MKKDLIDRFNGVISKAQATYFMRDLSNSLMVKMLTGQKLTRAERNEVNNAPIVERDSTAPNLAKMLKEGSKQ